MITISQLVNIIFSAIKCNRPYSVITAYNEQGEQGRPREIVRQGIVQRGPVLDCGRVVKITGWSRLQCILRHLQSTCCCRPTATRTAGRASKMVRTFNRAARISLFPIRIRYHLFISVLAIGCLTRFESEGQIFQCRGWMRQSRHFSTRQKMISSRPTHRVASQLISFSADVLGIRYKVIGKTNHIAYTNLVTFLSQHPHWRAIHSHNFQQRPRTRDKNLKTHSQLNS